MPTTNFELVRSHPISALNLEVQEYRHGPTGAQHVHLASENQENVFLVALRTVPKDSRGVAHILEHTALCGSKKYPVRDPFFMMTRRSLNTFMNAFTSSDWTAYPFASQSRKDYFNLLDVYLDAVFFPRLDKLDFAQEGHRLEFAEPGNPRSALTIKGIVFNEMKGAMSSPTSMLWHKLCEYLYPTTTYHYNSGGDPADIPDLTYEDFLNFHRTHYHPSNAIFMTFGDIPPAEIQQRIENQALADFSSQDDTISVPLEQRYTEPQYADVGYPIGAGDSTDRKTHVIMGWLLGDSTDLTGVMEAQLLTSVLLENSASPLQQALETTELGRAPSPLCGVDDSQREMCFVCGLEGCDEDSADQVEALILDTLRKVAEQGLPLDEVEACLHQLEIHQREISGDGMPYGLNLMMTSLNSATHRGDPAGLLDLEPVIAQLREKIQDPNYIPELTRRLLLENAHRVRLVMRPDPELRERTQQQEKDRLLHLESQLTEEQRQKIVEQAEQLQARQMQQDDPNVLPKVGLEDVPKSLKYPERQEANVDGASFTTYAAGTNGILYQQIIAELPKLNDDEMVLLPLLSHFMTEVGVADQSYLDVQKWQSRVTGGLSANYLVRATPDDSQQTRGFFSLGGKALVRNQSELSDLMQATLEACRFDETQRLREMIAQARLRSENSITGNGHSLAMTAAAQNFAPGAKLSHQAAGLAGISALKALDDSLNQNDQLQLLMTRLQKLHQKLLHQPQQRFVIGEPQYLEASTKHWQAVLKDNNAQQAPGFSLPKLEPGSANEMWIANTQVHFCAKAYQTVPSAHADAAALTVLAGFLRNNFLHRSIREQGGAYGGGASQDNNNGVFRFFSYRDPRLTETLADFDASINWLLSSQHEQRLVEEAILGVISQIDKPASPAGEAKQALVGELFGHNRETRDRFRTRVLSVTLDDLRRVAEAYLQTDRASTAVLTHEDSATLASELGLSIERL